MLFTPIDASDLYREFASGNEEKLIADLYAEIDHFADRSQVEFAFQELSRNQPEAWILGESEMGTTIRKS
jgi:hypothetical protein